MEDIFIEDLRIACSCGYPEREGYIHGAKRCRKVEVIPPPLPTDATKIEPLIERVVFVEEETVGRVKTVPHVRGDVRAVAMAGKSSALAGQRYLVSYRNVGDKISVVFEAMLVSRTKNAGGEEVLEFDNGVRIKDGLEWFRFQRSPGSE